MKEIFEKERETVYTAVLKIFLDCQNIISFLKYLEKEKEDESLLICSLNEEREKKKELREY